MQNSFILIAENDSDDQLFFSTALREYNTELKPMFFCNGEELIRFLGDETNKMPVAIFLDLNMPKMNGLEALLEIKRRPRYDHIPVIMISTTSNPFEINRCKKMGASDFVVKPNTFSQLSDSIKAALSCIEQC